MLRDLATYMASEWVSFNISAD